METKREPVLVPMAILGGLQVFFGGLAGITFLSGYPIVGAIAALGNLAIGAAQFGVMYWVRGQVVPTEDAQRAVNKAAATGAADTVA